MLQAALMYLCDAWRTDMSKVFVRSFVEALVVRFVFAAEDLFQE